MERDISSDPLVITAEPLDYEGAMDPEKGAFSFCRSFVSFHLFMDGDS